MNRRPLIQSLSLVLALLATSPVLSQKQALYESINKRDAASWKAAMEIWELAEPGYQETRSAGILAGMLMEAGFKVQKPVADIPTAFTATVGTGKPVIGILGEFDALPGLAQQASPQQESRPGNGYGHGCGHHLFGVDRVLGTAEGDDVYVVHCGERIGCRRDRVNTLKIEHRRQNIELRVLNVGLDGCIA